MAAAARQAQNAAQRSGDAVDVFWFVVILALYFTPTLAARGHPSIGGIAVLNVFLGWTLIGWVVALAWACSKPAPTANSKRNTQPAEVSRETPPAPPIEDRLAKLASLKERGMLTDEEFAAAKQRMLARSAGVSTQR